MKTLWVIIVSSIYFISQQTFAEPVVIDGILDDKVWLEVPLQTTNFEVIPQTLTPIEDNFNYQIYPNPKGLFIAITAVIKGNLRRRTQENDTLFSNDNVQVMIDMSNTEQFSYVFAVNHQGYSYDGIYKQNKELDLDWSTEWKYRVSHSESSWSAEIYVPWSVMTFGLKKTNTFGLSIIRYDESSNVTYSSIPASSTMNSFLSSFKKESVSLPSDSFFDAFPYIAFNRDIENSEDAYDVGVELFWKPSNNHLLSATINPDFGQVEADEIVVNFSAIENFFSERRPFFNENQNIFNVNGPENLRIIHTPRIGGESFYDEEYQSELDSAFKYTYGNQAFDLGLLAAFESTPSSNQGRDFWSIRGQSHFHSNKLGLSINRVITPSIERTSTVVSSDIALVISESTEIFGGIVTAGIEQGTEKFNDTGWWLTGSSEFSEQHIHEFSVFTYGENLQLNDVGFVRRVNRKQFEYEYIYQLPDANFSNVRDIAYSFEVELKTNFQKETLPSVFGLGVELETESEYEYQMSIEYGSSGVDDLITRGNRAVWFPSYYAAEFELSFPEYDWGSASLTLEIGTEGLSGKFYIFESSLERQLSDYLFSSLTLAQYNSESWFDWNEENLVDEYDFTEQSLEFSLDYQIAENQELRLKFEAVIGKANNLARYEVDESNNLLVIDGLNDFSFAESAFQLRYKYALSNVTAFYLSYGFGGEFEDDLAKFGQRNLYKRSIESKNAHNVFAKLRVKF